MRIFKIISALVVSGVISYAGASSNREVINTKAISVTYRSPADAYEYAHTACQQHWKKDIANIVTERPSFSVEIVTVNIRPKTVSALCVSKKYINNEVTKVAKF